MKPATAFRGQPVLVLLFLLVGWAGLRAAFWEAPLAEAQIALAQGRPGANHAQFDRPLALMPSAATQGAGNAHGPVVAMSGLPFRPILARAGKDAAIWIASPSSFASPREGRAPQNTDRGFQAGPGASGGGIDSNLFIGPPANPPATIQAASFPIPSAGGTARFSGDSWFLLRKDTTTPVTAGRGSYGQSQVGAVLRYRILPESGHRPAAYVRASKALASGGEAEGAIGLSARPLPSIPLTVAAEMRLMEARGQTYTRPAFYAVTELPAFKLPLGFAGEVYAQAGYVGGEFATAFVDGQVRVERPIVEVGPVEVSAGAGSWGGAQEGAERLDVGPGASVAVDLGSASARLSVDWRFRVAGEAEPSDGPAMTISAGF